MASDEFLVCRHTWAGHLTTGIHINNIIKPHISMGCHSSYTGAGTRESPEATGMVPGVERDHMAATNNTVMCTAAATMETVVIETEGADERLPKPREAKEDSLG